MFIVLNKKNIVYDKVLCECCETKCTQVLRTKLRYCCFDEIVAGVKRQQSTDNIASVDCLKQGNNTIILLEIKNQRLSNINIQDICLKIKETMQYLYDYEHSLLQGSKIKFYLAVPNKKYKENELNSHFTPYMQKFAKCLALQILKCFNDDTYKIKLEDETEYVLKSKIIKCEDTDNLCR